jgi:hypothetical protein
VKHAAGRWTTEADACILWCCYSLFGGPAYLAASDVQVGPSESACVGHGLLLQRAKEASESVTRLTTVMILTSKLKLTEHGKRLNGRLYCVSIFSFVAHSPHPGCCSLHFLFFSQHSSCPTN